MEFKTILFYMFAVLMLIGAIRVVTARNPVHAALFLVFAFFNAAGLWMLLQAEFLAIALLVVYVGAVMVLFLFVVMMLDINIETLRKGFWSHLPIGGLIGLAMVGEMAVKLGGSYFGLDAMPEPALPAGYSNTKDLGRALFTDYVYPFELASVILLVGIIAAIMLTNRKRKDTKAMKVGDQLKVRRNDRLRIVKMDAVKDVPAAEQAADAAAKGE